MQWTESQQQAIETHGANLLVSAAAGSGKTSVMVERIIRLIMNSKTTIDRVLVVTFTNAAAQSMREKIARAISTSPDINIRRQTNKLAGASIKTLHAFCGDIIRQYFYVADLDPSLRPASAEETELLLLESVNEVFEQGYSACEQGDTTIERITSMFECGTDDSQAKAKLISLYKFIMTQPNPFEWLEQKAAEYKVNPDKFDASAWGGALRRLVRFYADDAVNCLQQALAFVRKTNYTKPEQLLMSELEQAKLLTECKTCAEIEQFVKRCSFIDFPSKNRNDDPSVHYKIKDMRDYAKKQITEKINGLFSFSIEDNIVMMNALYPDIEGLIRTISNLYDVYSKKKLEKGIMDFHDLEHFALKILSNADVCNELKDRFDYIFVDEYQDCNAVQECIVNHLRRDRNLFLVGDVKQSIYRFRHADPTIFVSKMES
ncbi:MAG TPA: UvrD-helicase domain-containing protein, partial [Clostridia bacterium]|nr:UvrD-helicase domain-containing protein [Clostridia bacterium]